MKKEKGKAHYIIPLACLLVCCIVMLGIQLLQMNTLGGSESEQYIENTPIKGLIFTNLSSINVNEMHIVKKSCKELGITINFQNEELSQQEKLQKYMIDKACQPDFVMGGQVNTYTVYQLVKNGMLMPLNDLIKAYAPNIQKLLDEDPFFRQHVLVGDGQIYTLPKYYKDKPYDINQCLYINKTWLEKLNLEVPTTTEAFYEVLKAFRDNDPNENGKNDEIPFTYMTRAECGGDDLFIGAFGVLNQKEYMMVKDGEMLFAPLQEGYKEAMIYLSKLYKEELIDPQVFTQSNSIYATKGRGEESTLGAFIHYTAKDMVGPKYADDYVPILPLEGTRGERMWSNEGGGVIEPHRFMIISTSPYAKQIIQWIDGFFDPAKVVAYQIGEHDNELENDSCETQGNDVDGMFRLKNAPGIYGPGYMTEDIYTQIKEDSVQRMLKDNYTMYKPYLYEEGICLKQATYEEMEEIFRLYTAISSYVEEVTMGWIAGQKDIQVEWEGYKEGLKNLGVLRYIELYKEITNRCGRCSQGMPCS